MSKRANQEELICMNAPIRVHKLHRHVRTGSPSYLSRRADIREARRKRRYSERLKVSDPYHRGETNQSKEMPNEAESETPMNENFENKNRRHDDNTGLVDVFVEVTLFQLAREYPEEVKKVISTIFDLNCKAKNPILAFINALMTSIKGTYKFNTVTKRIAVDVPMESMAGNLKDLVNPNQKVKYTPPQQARQQFLDRWLKKGIEGRNNYIPETADDDDEDTE